MSVDPEDFLAADGEPWRPKLVKFIRWVVRDYLALSVAGPGQRLHQSRTGRVIVNEAPTVAFHGAFHVSLRPASLEARVTPGRVNGLMPSIEGTGLDGEEIETGKADPKGAPLVKLEGGAAEDGYSYVALRVRVDPGTGEIDLGQLANDAVSVVHVAQLDPAILSGGGGSQDREGVGLEPLAEIEWDDRGQVPRRVRQIVYFDRTHRFLRDGGEGPGRHVFGAVA